MSISHCFRSKVQKKSHIWKSKGGYRSNTSGVMRAKTCEIIEAHAMPDHIHMLVEIPPNQRVSDFMGYLKGKSTMIIFERYSNLKYKYGNRHFWCRGYYVSTVGGNKNGIAKYIREQEHEDIVYDQLSFKEWEDPFKKK